jgi:hypothetical protein
LHYFTARNITSAYSKLRALASVAERDHLVQKFDSTIIRAHMLAAGASFRMVPLVAPTRDDNMDDLMVASFIENPVVFEGKSVA